MRLINYILGKDEGGLVPLNNHFEGFFDFPHRAISGLGKDAELITKEDAKNVYVKTSLPGLEPKDIKVEVKKGRLVISAKKETSKKEQGKNYYHYVASSGSFYREVVLPGEVDGKKIKTEYKGGTLSVTLTKKEIRRKTGK